MKSVISILFQKVFPACVSCVCCEYAASQEISRQDTIIVAGSQYATSAKHQQRWGKHYRQEWNTPVKVKITMLDTLKGGLTPYEAGGGRQSKTLRLRDKSKREYVLRSIDKSFGKALPEIAQGTIIEEIANDQVSIAHPYGALTIPTLMEAADVLHTKPEIVYIPQQKALGKFNEDFGDDLYLFEQRPDENWEVAPHLGNSKNIIGTERLLEKLEDKSLNRVDQEAYVRTRLMDMLIGDWGRHEDQWRWAEFRKKDKAIYRPVPRDRDQAYTRFDGSMTGFIMSIAGLDHLQGFDETVKDIGLYNFPARNLDRRMANEITTEQWKRIAEDLQHRITDTVISQAIRKLPPEVFPISGPWMIERIRSRRNELVHYAEVYSKFLSKEVDIPGSNQQERFVIQGEGSAMKITVYAKDRGDDMEPVYERIFYETETKEIRLYGLGGDDIFDLKGKGNGTILLRLVPGPGDDTIHNQLQDQGNQVRVYDNEKNSSLNDYRYAHFEYDKKGFVFRPGLTVGLGYEIKKHKWRKEPFGTEHKWMVYYGPNRGSLSAEYRFRLNQAIGQWDFETITRADLPKVANFYGIGNETIMNEKVDRRFYRYRSSGLSIGISLGRVIDSIHTINLHTTVQTMKVRRDADRFIIKEAPIPSFSLEQKHYWHTGVSYRLYKADHEIVPTKGYFFDIAGTYSRNFRDGLSMYLWGSSIGGYIALTRNLSLAMRAGGETATGEPEFFQLPTLSGKENLRGYRRQRFYGETSFYNNNELRLLLDTRNRLFNGTVGALIFFDQGRVWQPGEDSKTWHSGYGAGIFLSPFNKILLNASYGISKDDRVMHMRIGFLF